METLEPPRVATPETEPELNLLLERDRLDDWRRWKTAAVVSAAFHAVLTVVLLAWPAGDTRVFEERVQPRPLQITHLITPTDLTQKAPNKDRISKEITIPTIAPRPEIKSPNVAAAPKKATAPLPPQVAREEKRPEFVEPPKIESPKTQLDSQSDQLARLNAPPPIAPPVQQPKIVFESPVPPPPSGAKPGGAIALPNTSVAGAIHDLATGGGTISGHQAVGDVGEVAPPGAGLSLPASPGRSQSNLELRSDPQGVDFRPYLIQVLAAVRRNWFAVYPEAAKTGVRGQAVMEFAIVKAGGVNKIVGAATSGLKPLDEAAVAAITASNPFPPLPKEFKGDRIVLRLTFMYNMQR